MRELLDKPIVEKFAFPGLQDRSNGNPIVEMPEPMPEIKEEKPKAVRKKKESVEAAPMGRKPLKLGKAKG